MTERRDYIGRFVCAKCGHTRALHDPLPGRPASAICASASCTCTGYVAIAPPATTQEENR